jgi:hypothetical protein
MWKNFKKEISKSEKRLRHAAKEERFLIGEEK